MLKIFIGNNILLDLISLNAQSAIVSPSLCLPLSPFLSSPAPDGLIEYLRQKPREPRRVIRLLKPRAINLLSYIQIILRVKITCHFLKGVPVCQSVINVLISKIIMNHFVDYYILQVLLFPVIIYGNFQKRTLYSAFPDNLSATEITASGVRFQQTKSWYWQLVVKIRLIVFPVLLFDYPFCYYHIIYILFVFILCLPVSTLQLY